MALRLSHNHRQASLRQFFGEVTKGFDADHIRYLVERQISTLDLLPEPLLPAAAEWMRKQGPFSLLVATAQERLEAFIEARPDCAQIVDTTRGRAWLALTFDVPITRKGGL